MESNRDHPPSPVKQRIPGSSPLKGMERIEPPVRSFKSFIRSVPPNPNTAKEKTLPPTPLPSGCQSPSPLFSFLPESILSSESWKASAESQEDSPPSQPFPTSSVSSVRNYSFIIPESSSRLYSMQTEPASRPFESNALELPQLQPLEAVSSFRPKTPPRHPARRSLLQLPSTQSALDVSMFLPDRPLPLNVSSSGVVTPKSCLEPDLQLRLQTTTNPRLIDRHISEASRKTKAHASLGTGSLQLNSANLMALSKDHELLPQHLGWDGFFDEQSPEGSSSDIPSNTSLESEDRRPLKSGASWDSARHLNHNSKSQIVDDDSSPFANNPAASQREHALKSKVDASLCKDHLISNTMPHTKYRTRAVISADMDWSPVQSSYVDAASQPLKHPRLFIRLPGGFALVRSLPSTNSFHDASDICGFSPLEESSPEDLSVRSPISASGTIRRQLSWNSMRSQKTAASAKTISRRLRESFRSLPSLHSRSTTSSLQTTSLAHEIPLPKTTPPLSQYSQRDLKTYPALWLRSEDGKTWSEGSFSRTRPDQDFFSRGIVNKARDVRSAWRKHQKELKHDKLKQSITVLGPTDPTMATDYIKRQGRRLEGEDVGSGRMPGYMIT